MNNKRIVAIMAVVFIAVMFSGFYTNQINSNKPQYTYQWLVKYISVETMQYKSSSKEWDVIYKVNSTGNNKIASVYITPKLSGFDWKHVKYTLKVGSKVKSDIIDLRDNSYFYFSSDLIPKKDKPITLIIEYGKEKTEIELNNIITGDLIPPEKALDIYMQNFSNEDIDKYHIYIGFEESESTKAWIFPIKEGIVHIDARTGQILGVYQGRDLF